MYLGTAVTVRGADNDQWDNTEYFLLRKSGLPVWCPGRDILRKFIVKELNAIPIGLYSNFQHVLSMWYLQKMLPRMDIL